VKTLNTYAPRFDPSVVPVTPVDAETATTTTLPLPQEQRGDASSGFWTSVDYHQRYSSGDLTPTIVVETLLPLIQRETTPHGKFSIGFLETKVDAVRAAAAASTKRYRDGKPLGPLDGVPVAVKDEVHLKGYKRTLGSRLDFSHGFDATSWCVQKWEEAGAIVIGKTTMHEVGIGRSLSLSPSLKKERRLTVQIQRITTPSRAHRAIRLIATTTAVARLGALATLSPQDLFQLPWVLMEEDPSAYRLHTAVSTASSPPTAASLLHPAHH
jgi:Amidase